MLLVYNAASRLAVLLLFSLSFSTGLQAADARAPLILAIDGINFRETRPLTQVGPFRTRPGVRNNYLRPAIESEWVGNGSFDDAMVRTTYWEGDLLNSRQRAQAREKVTSAIEAYSAIAQKEGRPFVIVGHSWGTALAAHGIANAELERPVDLFVTMGSPIGEPIRLLKYGEEALMGDLDDVRENLSLINRKTGKWINYWATKDPISGPINHSTIKNVQLESQRSITSHLVELALPGRQFEYSLNHLQYLEKDIARGIGADVALELLAHQRNAEASRDIGRVHLRLAQDDGRKTIEEGIGNREAWREALKPRTTRLGDPQRTPQDRLVQASFGEAFSGFMSQTVNSTGRRSTPFVGGFSGTRSGVRTGSFGGTFRGTNTYTLGRANPRYRNVPFTATMSGNVQGPPDGMLEGTVTTIIKDRRAPTRGNQFTYSGRTSIRPDGSLTADLHGDNFQFSAIRGITTGPATVGRSEIRIEQTATR